MGTSHRRRPVWEKKGLEGEWEGYEGVGGKGVYVAFVADGASRED